MIIEKLGLNIDFINQYSRLYTKYGEEMFKLEGISDGQLRPMNMFKKISESSNIANGSIDSSANVSGRSINTIKNESIKPLWKIFSHNKIYSDMSEKYGKQLADEWLEGQINGSYYIHDSTSASFLPYCYSFSLKLVYQKGLFFIEEMQGEKAKHLSTWVNHVCEMVNFSSNSISGAVSIPDMLIYMYKFYLDDINSGYIEINKAEKYLEQQFQTLIFRLNQPATRDGIQSAYVNMQIMDRPHLIEFFGQDTFNDGTPMLDYFDDFIKFQQKFLDYVNILREEKFFTMPVLTASLKINSNKEYEDEEVAKGVVKHNMKFQDTNIYNAEEISSLSSCCRLVNNVTEINKGKEKIEGFFSSIGGSSISIGSVKVGTINFARIAYESGGDFDKFIEILRHKLKLNNKMLDVHRDIIKKNIERGLLPIYNHKLIDLDKQFSTTGLSGIFESIKFMGGIEVNNIGEQNYSDYGKQMMNEIFITIKEENEKTLDLYGFTANAEQIPGESCNIVLRNKDSLLYKNSTIENTSIYGNQWLPLSVKADLNDRIDTCALYDPQCGGGAIGHFNLGEPIEDFEKAWDIAKYIAKKGVIYYSLIQRFNYCVNNHTFYGNKCPKCGGDVVGTGIKIVGYIVKEETFHDVRKKELNNRIFYDKDSIK